VEFHTFEEIATEPAMKLEVIQDQLVLKAVEEITKFEAEFHEVVSSKDNDIKSFWLRKTMKAVLAILIVEKNGKIFAYRGTNLEVSLPTGSLCAERNAIGTALSADLSLMREEIKLVAVFSAVYDENRLSRREQELFAPSDKPITSDYLESPTVTRVEKTVSSRSESFASHSSNGIQPSTPKFRNGFRSRAILEVNKTTVGSPPSIPILNNTDVDCQKDCLVPKLTDSFGKEDSFPSPQPFSSRKRSNSSNEKQLEQNAQRKRKKVPFSSPFYSSQESTLPNDMDHNNPSAQDDFGSYCTANLQDLVKTEIIECGERYCLPPLNFQPFSNLFSST
jgi:hypothetical protein